MPFGVPQLRVFEVAVLQVDARSFISRSGGAAVVVGRELQLVCLLFVFAGMSRIASEGVGDGHRAQSADFAVGRSHVDCLLQILPRGRGVALQVERRAHAKVGFPGVRIGLDSFFVEGDSFVELALADQLLSRRQRVSGGSRHLSKHAGGEQKGENQSDGGESVELHGGRRLFHDDDGRDNSRSHPVVQRMDDKGRAPIPSHSFQTKE